MTILNGLLGAGMMGEPDRLDATIRDLDELRTQFTRLVGLLVDKGVLTAAEEKKIRGIHEPLIVGLDPSKRHNV